MNLIKHRLGDCVNELEGFEFDEGTFVETRWHWPKGKKENGEDDYVSCIREFEEETDISVQDLKKTDIYEVFSWHVHSTKLWVLLPQEGDEGHDLEKDFSFEENFEVQCTQLMNAEELRELMSSVRENPWPRNVFERLLSDEWINKNIES